MRIDIRSRARWLRLPDGRDDRAVQQFAMAYDGYLLHGPSQTQLEAAVGHVLDMNSLCLVSTDASTEDLRAALFALARRAAHGWGAEDNITQQAVTHQILDELRTRERGRPFLAITSGQDAYGCTPPSFELDQAMTDSLTDVMLFSALQLGDLDPQQLAWLAITSKAEHAIRDAWGWMLQAALPGLSVAREWKKADLAILEDDEPRVIVEGKALYGFDALSATTRDKYTKLVAHDLQKARALAPQAYVLATVLMSTVQTPWSEERTASIGYLGNRKTTFLGEGGRTKATDLMWDALRDLGQVGTVDLGTGIAFGAEVNTTMFLVRPPARRDPGFTAP